MFWRAIGDVGDDVADIQPQFRCFDAGADATLNLPDPMGRWIATGALAE